MLSSKKAEEFFGASSSLRGLSPLPVGCAAMFDFASELGEALMSATTSPKLRSRYSRNWQSGTLRVRRDVGELSRRFWVRLCVCVCVVFVDSYGRWC